MIKYNNADKTPNEKGWIIDKKQLIGIVEQVSMYEDMVTMEQVEAVLLAAAGEIELLEQHPKAVEEDV